MSTLPRRGACPSLSAPMQTGDGLLLRLTPPWDGWPACSVTTLAEAAVRFGNGVLDITARGNLQVRGFRPDTVAPFVAALDEASIMTGPAVVAVTPLAGQDPREIADPRPLAARIAAELPPLAPKVSVLVDGGGALHLDAMEADLRLRAEDGCAWHLWAGPAYLGTVPEGQAAAAALALLGMLSAHGPQARMRDLVVESGNRGLLHSCRDGTKTGDTGAEGTEPAEPVGLHRLRSGLALGIAAGFGSIDAATLAAFARAAGCALRPAPGRALLAIGLMPAATEALRKTADGLGLVTSADDPRRRIAACPGAPACAAAEAATRPLATRLAARPELLPNGMVHLSGCPKGCAHPAPAAITLVGHAGTFGLIRDGSARSAPVRYIHPDLVPSALEHLT